MSINETPVANGSFGAVYKAKFKLLDVAVKRFNFNYNTIPDEELDLIMQEYNIMKKLQHENITKVYGLALHEKCLSIVMELADRGALLDFVENPEFRSNLKRQ